MAATLRYLTVPDILWLNQEITRSHQSYRFDKLEEAVFYQYAYGTSLDLADQAARFLAGWPKMKPFSWGNRPCAAVAALAFLRMNGRDVVLEGDSLDAWAEGFWNGSSGASSLGGQLVDYHVHDQDGVVPPQEIFAGVLSQYAGSVARLLQSEEPVQMRGMARTRLTGELI